MGETIGNRHLSYDAVVFDLLTALLNSWALWNRVAGSDQDGLRWRRQYLELTYGAGRYRDYAGIIREAAERADIPHEKAATLVDRWAELEPWPETESVLATLSERVPLGIATNASNALASIAVVASRGTFAAVVTAESAGFYKPRPRPYRQVLEQLGTDPARTLFVAGSAADVPGASSAGMPVYWHNRLGLAAVDDVRPLCVERSLAPLLDLV